MLLAEETIQTIIIVNFFASLGLGYWLNFSEDVKDSVVICFSFIALIIISMYSLGVLLARVY